MAHEESRFSHSANWRFCYNQSTERGATLPRSHGRDSLAGSAPALPNESGRPREEIRRQCAECQGQDPLPLLEEAHALAGGEFLEDDPYAEWAQPRRHTIDGARHRVLLKLVDLYLSGERVNLAEELLFAALEDDPTDEDALCRLMVLLVEQERRQEALHLYQYTEDVLQEEQTEPAIYTRELARRIRQGLVLRERGERYTAGGGQDGAPNDYTDGFGLKRVRLTNTAAHPCGGQTPSSYRYHLPRSRYRRQAALPVM